MSTLGSSPSAHGRNAEVSRKIAIAVGKRLLYFLEQSEDSNLNRLATNAHLSYSNLRLLADGKHMPSLHTLLSLAEYFNLYSVEELLGESLGTPVLRAHIREEWRDLA